MKRSRKKAGHRKWAAGNAPVAGTHTGDIMSPETRSSVMSRIKGKNTTPEVALARGLRKLGLYFSRHAKDLPGRPDIVFRRLRIAIFVDGDFWHGWRFPLWKHKLNLKWQQKIEANRERDRRNFSRLRRDGWLVIRIWEHQIDQSLPKCLAKLANLIELRRSPAGPLRSASPERDGAGAPPQSEPGPLGTSDA